MRSRKAKEPQKVFSISVLYLQCVVPFLYFGQNCENLDFKEVVWICNLNILLQIVLSKLVVVSGEILVMSENVGQISWECNLARL